MKQIVFTTLLLACLLALAAGCSQPPVDSKTPGAKPAPDTRDRTQSK